MTEGKLQVLAQFIIFRFVYKYGSYNDKWTDLAKLLGIELTKEQIADGEKRILSKVYDLKDYDSAPIADREISAMGCLASTLIGHLIDGGLPKDHERTVLKAIAILEVVMPKFHSKGVLKTYTIN